MSLRGYIILALVALAGSAFLFYYRAEWRVIGCVVYERLTDPPGVRTDGLCILEYLVRQDAKR